MLTTRALTLLYIVFLATPVLAQVDSGTCGTLKNHFGPFDYRSDKFVPTDNETHSHKLYLVESAHFYPRIEALISAEKKGRNPVGDDIDYTLRVFPNHHRALMAVKRLGEREQSQKPHGLRLVVECYFERAVRFRPDDAIVRMIYSTYLSSNKRVPEAIAQLEQATSIAGDSAFTHYNIGLTFFDLKIYDKALVQAHRALALGFERTELQELLQKAGQWQEPTPSSATSPALAPKPVQ
jgi:tetratricopeptide (TPR) repeat protein